MDDAGRLVGALVKEQVAALLERPQPRARDPVREQARVLERRDDIRGAVQHERGRADPGESLPDVRRLPQRRQLVAEHARRDRTGGAHPHLLVDELGMAPLELRRIQHRTGDPVRLLRRVRAAPEQRRHRAGRGRDRVWTRRVRRRQDQPAHAMLTLHGDTLRDDTAHRRAEHVRALTAGRLHDRGGVGGELLDADRKCPVLGVADPTRVVRNDAIPLRQRRQHGVEYAAGRAEAGNQQERVAVAIDARGEDRAVDASGRHGVLGHAATVCAIMEPVPRFFVDTRAVRGALVHLDGDSAAHLARSLRAQPGERIVVVEDGRLEHGVLLTEVDPAAVAGRIEWTRPATGEPHLQLHVLQAIPARGMDEAVEALAVAGVRAIHPVITERGVARPGSAPARHRVERWQTIAREAAQLGGRARPPAVSPPLPLDQALSTLPSACRILACVADSAATPLRAVDVAVDAPVGCVIGPEGGLGPRDLSQLRAAGATLVHLGARIVPSRLAGFLAASLLFASAADLDAAPAGAPAGGVATP